MYAPAASETSIHGEVNSADEARGKAKLVVFHEKALFAILARNQSR